jgi:DNA-directed RNA polymerase subunit RPC12/RpoP
MLMEKKRYRCRYCGSRRTISNGYRKTATLGLRHRRYCRNCGREFSVAATAKPNAAAAKKTKAK